jgi:hypothetical protein
MKLNFVILRHTRNIRLMNLTFVRPCAHWELYLRNYLVAWMEHTALYDSARTGDIFVVATHHMNQCVPFRQLNSSVTEVDSANKALNTTI